MLALRPTLFALLLAFAAAASAQNHRDSLAGSGVFPQGFDQTVYKGLVGNVLDAIPMDASKRLDLQRTNAVVGNTLLGRSLAVLAGLSNPVLLLGGFVWGVWAASNIKPAATVSEPKADPSQPERVAATQARHIALLDHALRADNAAANSLPEPILVSSVSAEDLDAAALSRSHVLKIWLPQRAPSQRR